MQLKELVAREKAALEEAAGLGVDSVSMHRPSRATLEADYSFDGLANSYSQEFFKNFKYLSDSRRRWREDVLSVVGSGAWERLHILTHPFWYHEEEVGLRETLAAWIKGAGPGRWREMDSNFTGLSDVLPERELFPEAGVGVSEMLAFLEEKGIPCAYAGAPGLRVEGFSSLKHYKKGTLTWVKAQDGLAEAGDPGAVALAVVQEGVDAPCPNAIICPESKRAFFALLERFFAPEEAPPRAAVGEGTYISPLVRLGADVRIGRNCVLDGDIQIGPGCRIGNNVSIVNKVRIGRNCAVQSGTSIGHDGFGYTEADGFKTMVRHFGGVRIGDDCCVGSNVSIDRGTIDDTVVGDNCKIDNLCHIAHNVVMGRGCTLIAGTILYGSSALGDNVYVATSIVRNQKKIGNDTMVGMGSVVTRDIGAGLVVVGAPAKEWRK